jgi:kumamolisin
MPSSEEIENAEPKKRRRARLRKSNRTPTQIKRNAMLVIDTNDNVGGKLPYLKNRGVIAIGRYYSSSAEKRVTRQEAEAIAAAGLKLFTVFEDGGDPALGGNAGTTDAKRALQQAKAIGQPEGSAIYFAMEHLPDGYTDKDIPGIKSYFQQIRAALQGKYKVGVYSDGLVCDTLLSAGLCDYAWLSASKAFEDTKQFYLAGRWSLAQQTPTDQNWNGLSVDTNEAKLTFGEFVPGAAPMVAVDAVTAMSSPADAPPAMPWMDWMRSHRGEMQQTGAKPTTFTEEIFKHTTFGPLNGTTPESCAATVCAALEETGYKSTHSAAAASYMSYGAKCDLKPGCVVVFRWPNGQHHVDFCDAIIDNATVRGLGGNQGHSLQDSDYSSKYIVATRWPVRIGADDGPAPSFRRASVESRSYAGAALRRRCLPYLRRSDPRSAMLSGGAVVRWTVPDLCKAYNWPSKLGGGGVIALVELDGGWTAADMAAFFQSIGQPIPHITDVSVDGMQNNPGQHVGEEHDPDVEVALDIQVAAASYFVATGQPAVIRVYWAANDDPGAMAAAVRAATADNCDVCSISWGSDEANWARWSQDAGRDFISDIEAAAEAASDAGMMVLASSGDNDSSDGGPTPANVDVPSSCPHVVGCGGTSKTPTSEVVWNDDPGRTDGQGTGGGYSTVFPPQSFQLGAPYPPRYLLGGDPPGRGRMVPDIAGNADPSTGYWMFVHGNKIPMGGTSAVAPLYAGLFAAFGRKLGFITPQLWQNRSCFNDIIQGENGAYQALLGPDPCTGLGSPIGTKLAALFGATTPKISSVVSQAGPAPGAGPTGWSGTIIYSYANGILVAPPQLATHSRATVIPRARPAATATVMLRHRHRYSATVTLAWFEQGVSNDYIEDMFSHLGFTHPVVIGSGAIRQAKGLWLGQDTMASLDPHLSNVIDLGEDDSTIGASIAHAQLA